MSRHQFNILVTAVTVCAAGLLQVSCSAQRAEAPAPTNSDVVSSASTTPTTPSGAPAVPSPPPMSQAFTDCMSQHGVALPAGPPSGPPPSSADQPTPPAFDQHIAPPGVDQATWENALRACESLAPEPPGK